MNKLLLIGTLFIPTILLASDNLGSVTHPDGSVTDYSNDNCKKVVCPGYTQWICGCKECSDSCEDTVFNEPGGVGISGNESECELSLGQDLYVDGKYVMCSGELPEKDDNERNHI